MPVAIPLTIWLSRPETDQYLAPEEVVRRLTWTFPDTVVDWERGKQYREERIQHLISLGCPEVLCAGERHLLDKTAYVGIEFPGWPGNPVFSHVSYLGGWDGLRFETKTHDLELLKRAGYALAKALNCQFCLVGGGSTLETDVVPGKHDPHEFVRRRYQMEQPEVPELREYQPEFEVPMLRELPDWKRSVHRGVVLFLRQYVLCHYDHRSNIEILTQGFSSYEEFATALLEELEAISPVQKCWSLAKKNPFWNAVLLDHGDWLTHIQLSGVPKGILT